ncbi:hypothetical protein ACWD4L_49470 [Streptomyces sp. NPDC002596]
MLAAVFGSVALVGAVMWLRTGLHDALTGLMRGIVVVVGSLGVGVLLGAVTGVALALSPEWLAARAPLRGLLAGYVAGTMYLGETIVVAVASDGGYGPMLLTLLSTLVVGAVAAVHSGDVLGRTHHHPWLASKGRPKGWSRRLGRVLGPRADGRVEGEVHLRLEEWARYLTTYLGGCLDALNERPHGTLISDLVQESLTRWYDKLALSTGITTGAGR